MPKRLSAARSICESAQRSACHSKTTRWIKRWKSTPCKSGRTPPLDWQAEMRRVMKSSGRIALGFTVHSGQQRSGLIERLTVAGFVEAKLMETDKAFCAGA